MELIFKKYFWTLHLAFLFLATGVLATGVNGFIESALLPLDLKGSSPASAKQKPVAPPAPLELERLAKLTGLPLPAEPTVQEPTEPVMDMNSPPVKTSLRVRLLGTLLARKKKHSRASIEDMSSQKTQTVMLHDKIQGAEVLEIQRAKVIILNNNRREYIGADTNDATPVAMHPGTIRPMSGPAVQEPGTMVTGSNIKAIDENTYEVPRAEIDKTLSNLNDVAMQARIVPAFKDGQAQGFKLFSIRPDSIYTKIGIQNGDVIRRINGFDLNSPEKALEIYSKLKEANRVEIEVERNGATLRKTYNVR